MPASVFSFERKIMQPPFCALQGHETHDGHQFSAVAAHLKVVVRPRAR